MAEQLAAVPEESTTGFTADYPQRNIYRDRIRTVVSGAPIRWARFTSQTSQSGHGFSYSSDSGASNSNQSNNSAGIVEFEDHELTRIAHSMVRDGVAQRMVQEFDDDASTAPAPNYGGHALKNWFLELDVDWVLQIHDQHGLQLQDKSASALQDLVDRWIRALIVIAVSVTELVFALQLQGPQLAVARFCKASIAEMLAFVDAVVPVLKAEKLLQAELDMLICVSCASHSVLTPIVISPEVKSIFNEIGGSFEIQGDRLSEAIASTMKQVRTLVKADESWAIEISRGVGEVHRNTRLMVDCIVLMRKAWTSMRNYALYGSIANLGDLINDTIYYVKDMLLTKSELCSDPSLRYLFLLNNSYFLVEVDDTSIPLIVEPWSGHEQGLKITPECARYINSYVDVSWGHVVCSIPKPHFLGPLLRWINKSSLAEFQSAFHKTYQTHKFWKVPDPQLRSLLQETITKRVISGYRNYLKEHPELEKQVSCGSNSPVVLELMLGELFEG